jgi:hypothetical protein
MQAPLSGDQSMLKKTIHTLVCSVAVLLATACDKKADNSLNYASAINNYYYNHPACLWSASKQMPSQAETSDHDKTMPYDALVDQGLLVRTTAEKKKFIVASKQVNNYDLSDKGRSAWTADETQPGFGNFCYGRRKVAGIDSSTPATSATGATTQVAYHYNLSGVPTWAQAPEIQNAYPQVRADLAAPQTSTATLTNTDAGWQVTSVPIPPSQPIAGADGKTVP